MPMLNQQAAEESNTMQQQQFMKQDSFSTNCSVTIPNCTYGTTGMSLIKPITKYLKYLSHAPLV